MKKPNKGKNSRSLNNSISLSNFFSTAPYNFIPLNEKVVEAPEVPDFDRYHKDRHTGYIEVEIEALTPLYIRDTLTPEEYRAKIELEKQNSTHPKTYINPDFFSPGGLIRIPGSSLRGMIRTLVEIVSYGKFEVFEKERKYHFRSFADKSLDLREQYSAVMIASDHRGYYPKVKAGYLFKRGLDYYIKPAKKINDVQFFRIEEKDAISCGVIKEPMKIFSHYSCPYHKNIRQENDGTCPECGRNLIKKYEDNKKYEVGYKKIKFVPAKPQTHNHSVEYYYAKVTKVWDFNDQKADPSAIEGTLVLSGWVGGKKEGKHLHWIIGPEDNSAMELKIEKLVIDDYRNDASRHKDCDLLRHFRGNKNNVKVPCFYIELNGKVISFGHTGMFRLAYKKQLKEFLPADLRDFNGIDLATAIFGNEKEFASRIFVEDAFLEGESKEALLDTDTPKILSNPKPTTFQHYLEQDLSKLSLNDKGNIRGLNTYNSDTLLRGYKLYWHKKTSEWIETDKKNIAKHRTQYTKITPVKESTVFKGRIRFENLSDVELGALLFVLDLPDGLAHKLGMGKPLGLGSVRIKTRLYLSDREKRYKELFCEWDSLNHEESNIGKYKKAFENYVLSSLKEKADSLWDLDRMKELRIMLNFDKKPEDIKTKYMDLNEFRERKVLPKPSEIVKP